MNGIQILNYARVALCVHAGYAIHPVLRKGVVLESTHIVSPACGHSDHNTTSNQYYRIVGNFGEHELNLVKWLSKFVIRLLSTHALSFNW